MKNTVVPVQYRKIKRYSLLLKKKIPAQENEDRKIFSLINW